MSTITVRHAIPAQQHTQTPANTSFRFMFAPCVSSTIVGRSLILSARGRLRNVADAACVGSTVRGSFGVDAGSDRHDVQNSNDFNPSPHAMSAISHDFEKLDAFYFGYRCDLQQGRLVAEIPNLPIPSRRRRHVLVRKTCLASPSPLIPG
jgi:hypothetical protein